MSEAQNWGVRDAVLLAIIPAELAVGALVANALSDASKLILATAATAVFATGFLVAVSLRRSLLADHWHAYREHLWRNLGISVLTAIGLALVVSGLQTFTGGESSSAAIALASPREAAATTLVASLAALMAPFTEEIVFRHELMAKFRGTAWLVLMVPLSSVLFGLVHWNNYDGDLVKMLPLMAGGLLLACVYLLTGNIWSNLMGHLFYNGTLTVLPTIFIVAVTLLTGQDPTA